MTNTQIYIGVSVIGVVLVASLSLFNGGSSGQKPSVTSTAQGGVVSQTSSGDTAAPQSDPQDIVPGMYKNQIQNTATRVGLVIQSGLVENNVDAQGKITNDHLEVVLKNTSAETMSDFEAYYTITDVQTGKSEGYYKKLTGVVLPSGESTAVHFDGGSGAHHFGVNKNGLYFVSKNKLQFDVQISAATFKIAQIQILKDAGGAEMKD